MQLPARAKKIKAMITALAVDNGEAISDRTLERMRPTTAGPNYLEIEAR